MASPDFSACVGLIRKEDPRFDRKAYEFVRDGLYHTVKELKKKDTSIVAGKTHVKGAQLLDGLRMFALDQYGPLAKTVLNSWGVKSCSDFGDIVFNLIEYNVFSKTKEDRREDFSEIYTFDEAFVRPFASAKAGRSGSSKSETEQVESS